MKYIAAIFIALTIAFVVWLFKVPDVDPENAELYIPTYQDSLSYLVENTDLIATIKISEANKVGQEYFVDYDPPSVASVISVYWEKDKTNPAPKKFKIQSTPAILHDRSSHAVMLLTNGEKLAFLNKTQNGSYRPTTVNSLCSVYNRGNVYPIWKQSNKKGEMSPGFPLEEIKREILAHTKAP